MTEVKNGIVVPFSRTRNVEDVVLRLGEMVREHLMSYQEKIKELTDRIQDLEGHAEHSTDGTCGVCTPPDDTETVGAGEYGTEIIVSDFESDCADPFCTTKILPGDDVRIVSEGKYIHDDC